MRPAALALVSGALVAVVTPASWLLAHRGPAQFGAAAAAQAAAAPAAPSAAPTAAAGPVPSATPVPTPARTASSRATPAAAPAVRTTSARLADLRLPAPDRPVSVRVRGVRAAVDAVGLDRRSGVDVPDDVRRAGWWHSGPQPGDPRGAAVLVGHVDSATRGAGAFSVLRRVRAGDVVRVQRRSGATLAYRVVARQELPKGEAVRRVFSSSGSPRLVLVSCGGAFDEATRSYEDNLVVTAVPVQP